MRERLRTNAPAAAAALAGLAVLAWLGLYGFAWNDYDIEAAPAFKALTDGHVERFLALAPAYGGSLELRAPFALLPSLWGGGELAVYRMVALPALLASAALAVWLVARMRLLRRDRLARACVLALCAANPITLRALEIGHAEELLTAVLCVAAVLAARGGRVRWAGLLLGLAIADKSWALVAAPVVVVAFESRARWRALAIAALVTAIVLAPPALSQTSSFVSSGAGAAGTGKIFQPWQVWWWTGHHGEVVRGRDGQLKRGYRAPPAWLDGITHPLIVALAPLLALLWRRRGGRRQDAMLLLALLLLLRCMLDPWDTVYYSLGFLLALLAWESEALRQPLLTLSATAGLWVVFQELPGRVTPDVQAAAYLALSLPLVTGLAVRLYAPALWERLRSRIQGQRRLPKPLVVGAGELDSVA